MVGKNHGVGESWPACCCRKWLSAAGPKAAPLVMVADTRKFTGWEAWWTNLYNESHLYFALLTVVLIPIIGLIFGLMADLVMK